MISWGQTRWHITLPCPRPDSRRRGYTTPQILRRSQLPCPPVTLPIRAGTPRIRSNLGGTKVPPSFKVRFILGAFGFRELNSKRCSVQTQIRCPRFPALSPPRCPVLHSIPGSETLARCFLLPCLSIPHSSPQHIMVYFSRDIRS